MSIRVKTSILELIGYIFKIVSLGSFFTALEIMGGVTTIIFTVVMYLVGVFIHGYEKKLEKTVKRKPFHRMDYNYLFIIGGILVVIASVLSCHKDTLTIGIPDISQTVFFVIGFYMIIASFRRLSFYEKLDGTKEREYYGKYLRRD